MKGEKKATYKEAGEEVNFSRGRGDFREQQQAREIS